MNASRRHVQARGVGSKAANRRLPHFFRWRVEDQFAVHVAHEPRGCFEFGFQLSGGPSRVADDQPGARWGIGLEQTTQEIETSGAMIEGLLASRSVA